MSFVYPYTFNNMTSIGNDSTDISQRNLYNSRFTNYTLANHFSKNSTDEHVKFAIQQPTMNFNGMTHGNGLNSGVVDTESNLTLKTQQERSFEKVQLFERPFLTIPYLGRGSCNPVLESQLQQGETVSDKKSVSTIMDKSFSKYSLYPVDDTMEERVKNPSYVVEESALNGWVRGGTATRDMSSDEAMKKNNRPNVFF
jgi:hypothetical protein